MTAGRTCLTNRIILLLAVACLPAVAFAASSQLIPQDLTMRTWTKQQGLPDDSVTAVLQTRDGYLWVGTSAGLARFDGVRFVQITPQSGKTNVSICVTALCEDSTGKLWIGTQGDGLLYCINGVVHRFEGNGGSPDKTINSIAEDGEGNLWLGTPSGLDRLEGGSLTRFTSKNGLPSDFVSNVHVARSGTIWITTRGGMCRFTDGQIHPYPFRTDSPGRNPESLGVYEDRHGNLWAFGDTYLVNLTEGKHLNHFGTGTTTSSMRIWSLCEGRDGELWIGTSGKGLYCFADDKFIPITFRNGGLTSDVRALCEDREGNLWLGTYGSGLVRVQPHNVQLLDTSTGLPNRPALCLALDAQSRAWIGFERDGLYVGSGESYERFPGADGVNFRNLVSTICVTPNSSVWIGTPGAGLYELINQRVIHYGTADGLADDDICSVEAESNGAVWVGTLSGSVHLIANGKITRFGVKSGLPNQPVTAILPARNGGAWIGFGGGHVFREANGRFQQIMDARRLSGRTIRAMSEDAAGRLWLGTADGRLGCLAGKSFFNWELNQGLRDGPIAGILTDKNGDLWLGTDRSIYRLTQGEIRGLLSNQISFRPQLIFRSDSLPEAVPAYGWPRAMKSAQGRLWFGLAGGVATLNTRGTVGSSVPPPVLIEQVAVNGEPLPHIPDSKQGSKTKTTRVPLRLSSNLRSLEIEFTALDFSEPDKVGFRYRLDGFDPDWVNGGGSRSVHYGQLPYGVYTFHVQAGMADQSWFPNEASFSFIIPTPIWRTGWALALYFLVAISLAAGVVRLVAHRRYQRRLAVLHAQQAMERERMRIAQDMHDEIGSKLTKISYMSERAKGELQGQDSVAGKLFSIANTSQDLLQSLDEIVWAVNPRNDTLEHVAAYLGQYATEYLQNTTVNCELHIPRGLPHYPFSAEVRHNLFLAFEESLNNTLKHGEASCVRIDMRIESLRFEILIEDNGCGFDADTLFLNGQAGGEFRGNGLRNMRQRLAAFDGECRIRSQRGSGTTVILCVPLTGQRARRSKERNA